MTFPITVPGPEPEWGSAYNLQGRAGNPASQGFLWDAARSTSREIAILLAPFDAVTARLRLVAEPVAEDLGYVDAATFAIGDVWYTISRFKDDDSHGVELAVTRDTVVDDDEALARLVAALGVPFEIVGHRRDGDTFFPDGTPTALDRLAGRVRLTLVTAGLPVVPNRGSRRGAGARIDVEPAEGPDGSVAVSWQPHPVTTKGAGTADGADPQALTRSAMADAMARILTAAGFTTVARGGRLLLIEEDVAQAWPA